MFFVFRVGTTILFCAFQHFKDFTMCWIPECSPDRATLRSLLSCLLRPSFPYLILFWTSSGFHLARCFFLCNSRQPDWTPNGCKMLYHNTQELRWKITWIKLIQILWWDKSLHPMSTESIFLFFQTHLLWISAFPFHFLNTQQLHINQDANESLASLGLYSPISFNKQNVWCPLCRLPQFLGWLLWQNPGLRPGMEKSP